MPPASRSCASCWTSRPEQESGEVEYKWLNPADNKVENKISQFRKVGDHVLCVGYYIPAPRPNMPRRCLTAPFGRSGQGAEAAFRSFNDRAAASSSRTNTSSPSASTTAVTAPAAARRTWWASMRSVTDAAGKPLFRT